MPVEDIRFSAMGDDFEASYEGERDENWTDIRQWERWPFWLPLNWAEQPGAHSQQQVPTHTYLQTPYSPTVRMSVPFKEDPGHPVYPN